MQRVVEAAAQMGRAHGRAGVQPYCPIDTDGDDSRLTAASGETEPTNGPGAIPAPRPVPTQQTPASTDVHVAVGRSGLELCRAFKERMLTLLRCKRRRPR